MNKICLMAVVACAVCSQAATYYVSEKGDDANDGLSAEKPFLSFDKGASMLKETPGNTLIVDEGLYSCEVRANFAENSTVLGKGPDKTTLVFCGNETTFSMKNSSDRSLVKGFTFTTDGPHACGLYWGADRAVLEDCVFADAQAFQASFGVVYFFGNKSVLRNVAITNCTAWQKTGGFYLNANQGLVENCRAENNKFSLAGTPGGANGYWHDYSMTIRNCTFGETSMTNAPSFWERTSSTGSISNCVFASKNEGSPDIPKIGCRIEKVFR